jgi:hypothetical protein
MRILEVVMSWRHAGGWWCMSRESQFDATSDGDSPAQS